MLKLIRLVAMLLYFIGMNAVLFIIFLTRPFHRNNVYLAGIVYASMSRLVGIKIDLRISDKVAEDESYIYIANHQNTYDLITICKAARPGVVTVGKKSLKWIPIFGVIYWLSANILIDRKNKGNARDTLSLTEEKMQEKDLSVWFFPEGTRSNGRGMLPFKTGAFRLALAGKRKIVPVVASQLHDKIDLNRWNNGTVIIEIMDPVEIDFNTNAKQLAADFHTIMQAKFEDISAQAEKMRG